MNRLLIIGKVPPPLGGVTTHVARLIAGLADRGFDFDFYDLRNACLKSFINEISRHRTIHLHTSDPWFQLLLALCCSLFRKTLMITYHGNWGRHHAFANLAVRLSARLCRYPVVQNQESLAAAKIENLNARCIPVYIARADKVPLPEDVAAMLNRLRLSFKFILCTHAWNVAIDKYGNEIYGISDLVAHMELFPDTALVIADPSGRYAPYLEQKLRWHPPNVLVLSGIYDFRSILDHCDGFVRNTTTDGSSISIEEALAAGKVVLASNVVSRSAGCRLFENIRKTDLEWELLEGRRFGTRVVTNSTPTLDLLISLYRTAQQVTCKA